MKWKKLLKDLKELAEANDEMNEEVREIDLLDNLASAGIGFASKMYMDKIKKSVKKGKTK